MKQRVFDPRRLDVQAFANEGATLTGDWPLPALERLASCAHADAAPDDGDRVRWQCRGELRAARGAGMQVWLHLEAATRLDLVCQRCLGPLPCAIEGRRSFLFVPGEAAAAELDAESEDDVLALTRSLDLAELIEDELLLSLPLVPRHEHCPVPLVSTAVDPGADDVPPHPFAALAALKRRERPD